MISNESICYLGVDFRRFGKILLTPKKKRYANSSFFFEKMKRSLKTHLGQHFVPTVVPKNSQIALLFMLKSDNLRDFPQMPKTLEKSGSNAVFQGFSSLLCLFHLFCYFLAAAACCFATSYPHFLCHMCL